MGRFCWVGLLASVAIGGTARADEPAPPPAPPLRRTFLLEGSAGLGTPVGGLGASAIVAPSPPIALHAGAGLGWQGWQIAAGARWRTELGVKRLLALGASWSSGAYAGGSAPIWYWSRAHVVNAEASLELDEKAFVVRPFLGVGYVLNGGDAIRSGVGDSTVTGYGLCPPDECDPGLGASLIPFIGVALAFGVL